MTPAIWPRRRSSGAASEEATVAGSAPGQRRRDRDHGEIDARQRRDRAESDRPRCPARTDPPASSEVPDRAADEWLGNVHATGGLFAFTERQAESRVPGRAAGQAVGGAPASDPVAEAVEIKIDDRRGVEREELREQQAADDGDAERPAQFRAGAVFQGQRQRAEQRGHGGHHDRAETQQAGLVDGFFRRQILRRVRLPARSRSS